MPNLAHNLQWIISINNNKKKQEGFLFFTEVTVQRNDSRALYHLWIKKKKKIEHHRTTGCSLLKLKMASANQKEVYFGASLSPYMTRDHTRSTSAAFSHSQTSTTSRFKKTVACFFQVLSALGKLVFSFKSLFRTLTLASILSVKILVNIVFRLN